MEATPENLSMLSTLLEQSLSPIPETRHPAEKSLKSGEEQPGFLLLVLMLVRSGQVPAHLRQAGGVYFKNVVKSRWAEEAEISQPDRSAIKAQIVPIMVSLSSSQSGRLQSQMGEAVAEIASHDFPDNWPTLLDDLINALSPTDFSINNGVLATAHSIFGRWRSQFKSNELFTTINYVLAKFCAPYMQLFQRVDELLSSSVPLPAGTSLPALAECLHLLLELFHDLNAQDMPEFFEDNSIVFLGGGGGNEYGLLGKYLRWERPELMGDADDDVPGPIQRIRASICEIAQLFATKYSELFPQLGMFVDGAWSMLGGVSMGTRDDQLVSKTAAFLSAVVRLGSHKNLFEKQETLQAFCDRIILPNMAIRPHEEEMFEDDPLEYIRQDLEPSTETDTRRQAATDFTKALMQNFEGQVTAIIGTHIQRFLADYQTDPAAKWKSKDTAIYLLTSIASRGSNALQGVTSTNTLVDIVQFFSDNVFADLQNATSHPILQVDAIKYLYTFRNQLTKEQLLSVLPLLVTHLGSPNYVIYSYAAVTIERILFIKHNGQMLFTQTDIRDVTMDILLACFRNIENAGSPEKMAENDYLMKCVMRVIITAKDGLIPRYQEILAKLVAIVQETSRNPSNPRFNQYNFESISALIRFVCGGNAEALGFFEQQLFPAVEYMLTNDVAEFIPYAFQLCAQLLELHPVNQLSPQYANLLVPLLHSALWSSRGNVPALVRLWKSLIVRGADTVVANGHLQGLLGIFQKLIGSKLTDIYAFDLISALYESVPNATMAPVTRPVLMLVLGRLQSSKTPQLLQTFSRFFLLLCAMDSVGPAFVVREVEAIQPGMTKQLLENFVLPESRKFQAKDRKIAAVGLTNILTQSDVIMQSTLVEAGPMVLEGALDVFMLAQEHEGKATEVDGVEDLDPEDTTFQASFSKLGASEAKARDPLARVPDAKAYLSRQLASASARHPGKYGAFLNVVPQATAQPFIAYMDSQSDVLA